MYEAQDIFRTFDHIEMLVIRIFGLIGLLLICLLVLWSHIRSFWETRGQQREMGNRRKRRSVNKKR